MIARKGNARTAPSWRTESDRSKATMDVSQCPTISVKHNRKAALALHANHWQTNNKGQSMVLKQIEIAGAGDFLFTHITFKDSFITPSTSIVVGGRREIL